MEKLTIDLGTRIMEWYGGDAEDIYVNNIKNQIMEDRVLLIEEITIDDEEKAIFIPVSSIVSLTYTD